MDQRLAYSVSEACQIAAIGRTTLYSAIGTRKLPARKIGRRTVILAEDLRRFLENMPAMGVHVARKRTDAAS
jgi:excisionase family DNA binding protein